jgi:hypothetical protein
MYWLMRPVFGWGAVLLIHAVAVPLVYRLGKAKGVRQSHCAEAITAPEAIEPGL